MLNFGVARKNVSVRAYALNFGVARKNVGVQDRAINLALCGVHTHNNDVCGVCIIGTLQWSMVIACARCVNVVAQQFSEWCAQSIGSRWGVLNIGMV
jgi:hypothetical protein